MKPTKDEQFYIDKSLEFAQKLYDEGEITLNDLLKIKKANRDKVLQEVANVLLSYKIEDKILSVTTQEKQKLHNKFGELVTDLFMSQYKNDTKQITDILTNIIEDKYNSNTYLLKLGMDFKASKIDSKDIKEILNYKIDGKNYSDRIYDNSNKVAKQLKIELDKLFNGETNVNSIEKIIKDRFNVDASNTSRLVQNEMARVQTDINQQWAEDNNIEYEMWSATLDDKTAEYDASLDGKVFRVDDSSKPIPIQDTHVGCRCTYVALPNKDYRPTSRLDNKTRGTIDWKSYEEWKNDNEE
ncbi:minor capsid protein [Inconstantimicrobium mannanitabidum]|uniref:Uncharacterized protein n=1 Tax=Inconstantimicrobium mannanitabidum TaxID=1604901 RepID=A0ACB5RAD6_9CLOT|nr:minor capsid protein [Clostridium sp. TW13]GKX65829.1 hypothetical protein rsdtw13_10870 [Clostridium sp. TW13]